MLVQSTAWARCGGRQRLVYGGHWPSCNCVAWRHQHEQPLFNQTLLRQGVITHAYQLGLPDRSSLNQFACPNPRVALKLPLHG